MSDHTSIEWTDATWNPIRGVLGKWSCVKVSPGCTNCYAEAMNIRFGGPRYTVGADELRLDEEVLTQPLHWKKPRRVFVCSMTDLFEERVMDEWIDQVFAVMALSPQHTFQVLTKGAARMHAHVFDDRCLYRTQAALSDEELRAAHERLIRWPLPNVWLGVSAEDQERYEERWDALRHTPAALRFLSLEPLLGPIDLRLGDSRTLGLSWVIVGGESGPGARPMKLSWVRQIVADCKADGVACFVKQDYGPRPGKRGRIPYELWVKEYPQPRMFDGW